MNMGKIRDFFQSAEQGRNWAYRAIDACPGMTDEVGIDSEFVEGLAEECSPNPEAFVAGFTGVWNDFVEETAPRRDGLLSRIARGLSQ